MRVERYGAGSPALIFIPGLGCGSWVWRDAVARFAGKHAVYLVTLAGFDGVPPAAGDPIDEADASLSALVAREKLVRPIVIGHSLGGFLALRFGIEYPDLVSGIVAVDGLPVFPSFENLTPPERAKTADALTAKIANDTHAQFFAAQHALLATMITDPADVDRVAPLVATSDPKAVAAYANELLRTDLRPQLSALTAPVLEIAPVPTVPAPFEDTAAASTPMRERQAAYKSFYASLLAGAPHATVVTIPNAKHFVMLDQPKALYDAIAAFVANPGAPPASPAPRRRSARSSH